MIDAKLYELVFQGREDGKEVLEDLCKRFYDRPSYVRGDPYETAYNEGCRAAIHYILQKIAQSQQPKEIED